MIGIEEPRARSLFKLVVKGDLATADTAKAYDQAADDYVAYADGDPQHLFAFEGHHAFADRHVWSVLDAKLRNLRATGATSVSILDAGCGPGTWLRRIVTRAHLLGFTSITARGFDVSDVQVRSARRNAASLTRTAGVDLSFDRADLEDRLPESDASVDMVVCLYSVLSHLPVANLPRVGTEIARVTKGHFVTTVRSTGSPPTAFVDSIEAARRFRLDHDRDRCEIEFRDGRRIVLRFHLFTAGELLRCFAGRLEIEDLCGLDIFHGRFSPDKRWHPSAISADPRFANLLAQLETRSMRNPSFMARATHLMLVGRRRQQLNT